MFKKLAENQCRFLSIFVLLSVILAFGLGACSPGEATLPFETIEQKDWAGTGNSYEFREPGLMIVSRSEEVSNLSRLVTIESMRKLQTLDYGRYFALVVFQGRKQSTGYNIQVNRIGRSGNIVNVYAQFFEPKPDQIVGFEVTSPYHLVKVEKIGSWGQDNTFNLLAGETLVASLSRAIPYP